MVGFLYQGFDGLFNIGDILSGDIFITQYTTQYLSNYSENNFYYTMRPLLVNGELVSLPDETYKVITYSDFINNHFVKWSVKAQNQVSNTFTIWSPKLCFSPIYRYPLGDDKIIYSFSVVTTPVTDEILPYDGELKIMIYIQQSLQSYDTELIFLIEQVIETYSNSTLTGNITYEIEYFADNSELVNLYNIFSLNEYFYNLGGIKSYANADIGIVISNLFGISYGSISGEMTLWRIPEWILSSFSNNSITYSNLVKHEFGHVLGSFHTFACSWQHIHNELETLYLDNITNDTTQGICDLCDGYHIPYSAETNGDAAIMSYSSLFKTDCLQPIYHSQLLSGEVINNMGLYTTISSVTLYNNSSINAWSDNYNFGYTNINYTQFIEDSYIIGDSVSASFTYESYFFNSPSNDLLYVKVYLTYDGDNLFEIFNSLPGEGVTTITTFTYQLTSEQINQITSLSNYSKIGIKFESTTYSDLSNNRTFRISSGSLYMNFNNESLQPKDEYSVVYTDDTLSAIDYTYNTPWVGIGKADNYTSYEEYVMNLTNILRKNYFTL